MTPLEKVNARRILNLVTNDFESTFIETYEDEEGIAHTITKFPSLDELQAVANSWRKYNMLITILDYDASDKKLTIDIDMPYISMKYKVTVDIRAFIIHDRL